MISLLVFCILCSFKKSHISGFVRGFVQTKPRTKPGFCSRFCSRFCSNKAISRSGSIIFRLETVKAFQNKWLGRISKKNHGERGQIRKKCVTRFANALFSYLVYVVVCQPPVHEVFSVFCLGLYAFVFARFNSLGLFAEPKFVLCMEFSWKSRQCCWQ